MTGDKKVNWLARLKTALPYLVGIGIVIALVLAVNPQRFALAASRFNPVYAPVVAAFSFGYYLLQGVRWQPLLLAVGARLRLRDTIVLNFAGQAAGLLPGGELTRAVLVSEVAHVEVGATIATITVQELIYTVLLIAAAVPGALHHTIAAVGVSIALAGVLAITGILTVQPIFARLVAVVRRLPLLRRFVPDVLELQRDTVSLLRRWDTLYWSSLSAVQAVGTITMFWLVIQAIDPGQVSWPNAAFAYTVASIAGALSLGPGGLGGFEAAGVGMLLVVGVPFQIAVAATVLQRAADKGLGTVYGSAAYLYARQHYGLKAAQVIRHGQRRGRPPGIRQEV
ncbi:MAG TPA: lysylphosphatidylglycerol synthase transmembrane domain-containing protein [Candidatus Dormibacteraeota bacterium]|nr:lysylphosphatidylglycerol synthase transmembrane domain-containing protein [Candidatus Dormibacteraeota bacterium]